MSGVFTSAEASVLQSLLELQKQMAEVNNRLASLEPLSDLPERVAELQESLDAMTQQKDWYSTAEVSTLTGKTQHTIQVRWCAEGRIEAEKDPATGHWRIPGHEYERLRRGGKPRPT